MIRLLLVGVVILLSYRLMKSLGASLFKPKDEGAWEGASDECAELLKDPQCGTYFLKQRGVQARIKGQNVYFCSETCLNEYIKNHTSS